jgi:uncharacterized membrane protein
LDTTRRTPLKAQDVKTAIANLRKATLVQHNKGVLTVKPDKKKELLQLLKFIPLENHSFYQNLKMSDCVSD